MAAPENKLVALRASTQQAGCAFRIVARHLHRCLIVAGFQTLPDDYGTGLLQQTVPAAGCWSFSPCADTAGDSRHAMVSSNSALRAKWLTSSSRYSSSSALFFSSSYWQRLLLA